MTARTMLRATVVTVGLAALGMASYATAQMSSADSAIEARKKLMKEQGAAWKNIQDKTKAGQVKDLVPDAEKLLSTSKEIPSLFPEGSLNPEKSAAKPEIWQKRAEFDAAAKNLETWAMKLRDTAATDNAEQTQAIVKDFGRQACGTCHTPFRVPPPPPPKPA
jgi:cytochrome c556